MVRLINVLVCGSLLLPSIVFANEAQPSQNFEDNKAVVAIQKQPTGDNQKQTIKNNWFCIVIQVNGKAIEGVRDVDNK